ncbi:MAG: class I SAM-dependent methyltransferase [Acidobacteriota bacterium]
MGAPCAGLTAVFRVGVSALLLCLSAAPTVFTTQALPLTGARRSNLPYVAVRSIVDALPRDRIPADLRSKTPAARESAWPDWVAGRDRDIRARLALGDEDSIFNLTLFGTTFTNQRPLTERDIADTADGRAMPDIVRLRIRDLIQGLATPGTNERLDFARVVARRQPIDLAAPDAERRLRDWLEKGIARVVAEYGRHADLVDGPASSDADRATLFRDRGLSSDTSIFPGFGIEQTLAVLMANSLVAAGSVHRVAIVGPGLDFADKRQGYDFYPVQTIQPFAVIDSLIRLGLASPGQIRVTTFDVSPRVNQHLEGARQRADVGGAYLLNLPQRTDLFRWSPYLVSYWANLGDRIGTAIPPAAAPPDTVPVKMRTVHVRADIVKAIVPDDLNIVVQRLDPLASGDLFDLIIATNVLVYYDVFEQSLALSNVGTMLRPGGLFLSNQVVQPLPSIPMEMLGHTDVPMELAAASNNGRPSKPVGDRFFSYRRLSSPAVSGAAGRNP